MTEIPVPDETGVAGTQRPGTNDPALFDATPPLHGLPMTQVIEGLAASRPRSFGGEVPAALVAGAVTHLSHDLRDAQRMAQAKDEQLQRAQKELAMANVTIAKLSERLGATKGTQRLKQFCIFVGTALLGLSVDLFKNNLETPAYLIGALGGALLAFGWLTRSNGGDE